MDRNHQDLLDQNNIPKKHSGFIEGGETVLTSDSHKRKRIHLFSNGTRNWQNIASLIAVFDIVAVNLAYSLALWFWFDCHISSIPQIYLRAWVTT